MHSARVHALECGCPVPKKGELTLTVPHPPCQRAQGKTGGNALDKVGGAGHMRAAGGGSNPDDQAAGGSGRRMQFTAERG